MKIKPAVASGMAAAVMAAGCGGESQEFPNAIQDPIRLMGIDMPGFADTVLGEPYKEYDSFEIGGAVVHLATVGEVPDDGSLPKKIYTSTLESYTRMVEADSTSSLDVLDKDGKSIGQIELEMFIREDERYFLTVAGDIPSPDGRPFQSFGLALTNMRAEPLVSLATAYERRDGMEVDLFEAATEICQSGINVETQNDEQLGFLPGAADLAAQEIVCNTVASAFVAARLFEMSYEDYVKIAKEVTAGIRVPINDPSGSYIKLGYVSEAFFTALKHDQPVTLDGQIRQFEPATPTA